MVKSEEEWHELLRHPPLLDDMLATIGYPWMSENLSSTTNL